MTETGYQVVHAIPGRIRLRIVWLETDADSAGKLQRLLESFNFVSGVRVNPVAQSIVINYKTSAISSQEAAERFVTAMQQIKPTPVASPPPPGQTEGEAVVQMAQTVAQTVAQTMQSVAKTMQSVAQTANTATQDSAGDQASTESSPEPPTQTPTEAPTETKAPPAPAAAPTKNAGSPQQKAKPAVIPDIPSPWDEPSSEKPSVIGDKPAPTAAVTAPHPSPTANAPDPPELWLHSTASLAKRLNVTSQAITRHRSQSDFSTWTQQQDPERIAWSYDASSQSFYPFTTLASPLEKPGTKTTPSADATPSQETNLEKTGAALIGETIGEAVGTVMGELLGEVALGSVGAVVGEEIGRVVGEEIGADIDKQTVQNKQVSDTEELAGKSTPAENNPQTDKSTSDREDTLPTPEDSEAIEDNPKAVTRGRKKTSNAMKKSTDKRSSPKPHP